MENEQLRVIRAFKSTLEDLEEKRSEHSVHSLRSSRSQPGLRPISDVTHSDESQLLKAASAHQITPGEREQYYNYDRNQLRPPPGSAPYALTSDGLMTVGGGGDHMSDRERDRQQRHQQRLQQQHQSQRHSAAAEMSNNNNNRASERKSGGGGSSAAAGGNGGNGGPALNGHHASQPQAPRSYSPFSAAASHPIQQGTMSPPQLLTNPFPHQPMASAAGSYHHHYQMPPSGLLPVRAYDPVFDYDLSLPDLPADLPRLVHETSI